LVFVQIGQEDLLCILFIAEFDFCCCWNPSSCCAVAYIVGSAISLRGRFVCQLRCASSVILFSQRSSNNEYLFVALYQSLLLNFGVVSRIVVFHGRWSARPMHRAHVSLIAGIT